MQTDKLGLVVIGCLGLVAAGCATEMKHRQYEDVAKEYSRAIRANQVIPVYPMSQDVTVGDAFIVERPIEDEHMLWEGPGYVPLGQHFYRLPLGKDDYDAMYASKAWDWASSGQVLPAMFERSGQGPRTPQTDEGEASRRALQRWRLLAPQAQFPSYTIAISSSAGLDVGMPVQGVPIAFGLLNVEQANASITMKEAYTYGIDGVSIDAALSRALDKAESRLRDGLKGYAPQWVRGKDGTYILRRRYLRIITRVYAVGGVAITISDSSSRGMRGSVGLAKNLELVSNQATNAETYTKLISELNKPLATTAALKANVSATQPATQPVAGSTESTQGGSTLGGSAKIAVASDRSITMNETFDRPLTVGYLAIDIAIGKDGALGTRTIDTFNRINHFGSLSSHNDVKDWLLTNPEAGDILRAWATTESAQQWMNAFGFKDFQAHPEKIFDYYVYKNWFKRFCEHPTWLSRYNALSHRIIEECINQPSDLLRLTEERSSRSPATTPVEAKLSVQQFGSGGSR